MREDTQKALKEYEVSSFLFKKEIEEAEKLISENEAVIIVLTTNFSITYPDPTKRVACPGIVFLTDKRMIVFYKDYKDDVTDITPIAEFKSVIHVKDPANHTNHIQVHTKDKIYDFLAMPKVKAFSLSSQRDIDKKAMHMYHAFLYAQNPDGFENNTAENNNQSADIPEQIEKLASLKEKGILSEEEFQAKKSELLARL